MILVMHHVIAVIITAITLANNVCHWIVVVNKGCYERKLSTYYSDWGP